MDLLLDFQRYKFIDFSDYERRFGGGMRTFQRDITGLRQIGKESGFQISKIQKRQRVEMIDHEGSSRQLETSPSAKNLLAVLSNALGVPVARELGVSETAASDQDFLRFLIPRLRETNRSVAVYDALKAAWATKPMPTIVEFDFDAGKGAGRSTRRVEPYRIILRSGRDYLLAYDLTKGWRTFGMDCILTVPRKAGSIQTLRTIPPQYDSTDVLGFFKTGGSPTSVTIELSQRVASSIASRQWQQAQVVKTLRNGRMHITFDIYELDEVVRWTFGLGTEARIIAPEKAVALAKKTSELIAASYEDESS
ncbi:MAG: WYL domain-containing protein [Candidatus Eremiobacteraeota bacterium]|nr:WYL domain-containing protein [Candidatus Eremiobacteraeota bacterium]